MRCRTAVLPLIVLSLSALPSLGAQERRGAREPAPTRAGPVAGIFDLEFEGGDLNDFLAALRRHAPRANIVVNDLELAASYDVPQLVLKSVNIVTALGAVESLGAAREDIRLDSKMIVTPMSREDAASLEPVHVVSLRGARAKAPPKRGPEKVAVLALHEILGPDFSEQALETTLGALSTAFELAEAPESVLRFHTESRLLFVRGTEDEIALAQVVLEQFESVRNRTEAEARRAARLEELESATKQYEKATRTLREEFERSSVRLESVQRELEISRARESEARTNAEERLSDLRAQTEKLQSENANLRAALAKSEKSASR